MLRAATDAIIIRRSREGAWIEMRICLGIGKVVIVAPVRERGLKCIANEKLPYEIESLP